MTLRSTYDPYNQPCGERQGRTQTPAAAPRGCTLPLGHGYIPGMEPGTRRVVGTRETVEQTHELKHIPPHFSGPVSA